MNKRMIAFYALVAVSAIGLTYFVQIHPISNLDLYMAREIQEQRAWNLTPLMKFISFFGNPGIASLSILIASLSFFLAYRRREAYFTFAVILADLCNMILKILIHRPRPTLENTRKVLQFAQFGFPSSHVVHYVVFFGFLLAVMFFNKKIPAFWRIFISIFSAFLILTVSVSRIYLGAHWATDVIGGYLFGFTYLGIILKFYLEDPKFNRH